MKIKKVVDKTFKDMSLKVQYRPNLKPLLSDSSDVFKGRFKYVGYDFFKNCVPISNPLPGVSCMMIDTEGGIFRNIGRLRSTFYIKYLY